MARSSEPSSVCSSLIANRARWSFGNPITLSLHLEENARPYTRLASRRGRRLSRQKNEPIFVSCMIRILPSISTSSAVSFTPSLERATQTYNPSYSSPPYCTLYGYSKKEWPYYVPAVPVSALRMNKPCCLHCMPPRGEESRAARSSGAFACTRSARPARFNVRCLPDLQ